MTPAFEILRVAERALLIRFLDDDLARAVARSTAAVESLRQQIDPAMRGEWIPGAGNLLLRIDDPAEAPDIAGARDRLDVCLRSLPSDALSPAGRTIEAAVRFGGAEGEDLPAVARRTGLSEVEVVARICAVDLTVAFVGFSPGFPYLVGLPPDLELPRLATPRTRVPAGSVAIAGPFAGIYPSTTPGGWHLVGRTGITLFDPAVSPPALLAPGDRVRFVAA
jgi:KipI family sensor histidine kinase inhibitor